MKRLIALLLGVIMLFTLLCGCGNKSTLSENESMSNTVTSTDSTQLYMQFLNGEIAAKGSDGTQKHINEFAIYGQLPQDYRYTFFDVNYDGEKELCVGEYKYILCFRIINGEIEFYETLTDTKLLTNGAVLYDHSSLGYEQYIYKSDKFEENFEYLSYELDGQIGYFIGGAAVSKDEYDNRLDEYLSIPEVDWFDQYGNVIVNTPGMHDKMMSIMRNEATYIDESGKSIYISESAQTDYDDLIAKPKQFTYFDVDRDGEREMIVGITLGGEYAVYYVILDHDDGEIYGHLLVIRALQMLKKDGTFNQTGGAGTNQIARLKLDKTKIEYIVLAENFYTDSIYTIDGKDVTKKEIDTYYDQFYAKEDVDWSDAETLNLIEKQEENHEN